MANNIGPNPIILTQDGTAVSAGEKEVVAISYTISDGAGGHCKLVDEDGYTIWETYIPSGSATTCVAENICFGPGTYLNLNLANTTAITGTDAKVLIYFK